VLQDSRLAEQLLKIHATLQHGMNDPIMSETYVLELLESLFARLKQPSPTPIAGALSTRQLRLVREFVEANIADKIILGRSIPACRPRSIPVLKTV
jgi:hypothetical protein